MLPLQLVLELLLPICFAASNAAFCFEIFAEFCYPVAGVIVNVVVVVVVIVILYSHTCVCGCVSWKCILLLVSRPCHPYHDQKLSHILIGYHMIWGYYSISSSSSSHTHTQPTYTASTELAHTLTHTHMYTNAHHCSHLQHIILINSNQNA